METELTVDLFCPRYHKHDQHKNRQRKQSAINLRCKDYLPKKLQI